MKINHLILCGSVLLSSCANSRERTVDESVAREFYRQPPSVQQSVFRARPLLDQLNLFFLGNQAHHPPAIYLAECYALGGAPAVDLLRTKLGEGPDDLTVRDIALLLATIDAMSQYDVAGDTKLLALLQRKVAQMRDVGWRETAEKKTASIGHERNKHPSYGTACH